jgi:predicted dehydrogenase
MKISQAIVFGSNFGLKSHLRSLKKFKSIKNLYIYSPNIKKKVVSNKYILENFKNINLKKFQLFSIATSPKEQKKICKLGLKNKIKYFFLEKPVSNSFKSTCKILDNFKKKKIKYIINFIYPNIEAFKILKKNIKNKKIKSVFYRWSFQQAYFKNFQKTWKIDPENGGGIVNFYLIHVIYNLLFLFGKFKIINFEYKKIKKIIYSINIKLIFENRISGCIYLEINSKQNLHSVKVNSKNSIYEIKNKSKDWVKNFYYYKNTKKIAKNLKNNLTREQLTEINFNRLINHRLKNSELINYRLAHLYCETINQKIKND